MAFDLQLSATGLDELVTAIGDHARRAIPPALTATARDVDDDLTAGLSIDLDNPTPFTQRAFDVWPASIARPAAKVVMLPIQSRYLHWEIEGGQRAVKGFELRIQGKTYKAYAVPGQDTPLDAHGNVSRAYISRIIADLGRPGSGARYFVGAPQNNPGKPAGVWQRDGNKLRPVFVFESSTQYAPRYKWRDRAQASAEKWFPYRLAEALAKHAR